MALLNTKNGEIDSEIGELKEAVNTNSLDTGSIFILAKGYNAPIKDALPCTGGEYTRSAYPALFDRIGYSYGGTISGNSKGFTGVPNTLYIQPENSGCASADPYTSDIYAIYNTSSNFIGAAHLVKFNSNREFVSNSLIVNTNSSSKYVNLYFSAHGVTVFSYNASAYYYYSIDGTGVNYVGSQLGLGNSFATGSTFIPISTSKGVYFVGKNTVSGNNKMAIAYFDPDTKQFSLIFSTYLSANQELTAAGGTGKYAFVHVGDTNIMDSNAYFRLDGASYVRIKCAENVARSPSFYYSGKYYVFSNLNVDQKSIPKAMFAYFSSVPSTIDANLTCSYIGCSIYGGEEREFAMSPNSYNLTCITDGLLMLPIMQKSINDTSSSSSFSNDAWLFIDLKHVTGGFANAYIEPNRSIGSSILFLETETQLCYGTKYTLKTDYPKFKILMTSNITPFGNYYIKT